MDVFDAQWIVLTTLCPGHICRIRTRSLSFAGPSPRIDRARLWRPAGDMRSVIAWITAHSPAHSTLDGTSESGTGTTGAPPSPGHPAGVAHVREMGITFALPASGAALASRQVLVSVAADGRGEVALRVDVQDVWYPTRPTWSYVWKVDAVATITVWAGDGGTDPRTIVTTKPATVARLRRLVNAMPMSTGGISGCVLERGQHFSVQFSGRHAPMVALSGSAPECGGVTLSEPGHAAINLQDTGDHLLAAAETLAGTSPIG